MQVSFAKSSVMKRQWAEFDIIAERLKATASTNAITTVPLEDCFGGFLLQRGTADRAERPSCKNAATLVRQDWLPCRLYRGGFPMANVRRFWGLCRDEKRQGPM